MTECHTSEVSTEIGGLVPVINPKYDPEAESPMGRKKDFPAEKYPNYQ